MSGREGGGFDETITSERAILRDYITRGEDLPTDVPTIGSPFEENHVPESELGVYRSPDARKLVTADLDVIQELAAKSKSPPSFLEAGPRRHLFYDPRGVRVAVVTTGGLAPGLNSIVHSIVKRHFRTYKLNEGMEGAVFGVYDSFIGLKHKPMQMAPLRPHETEEWLEKGGSELGNRRTGKGADLDGFAHDLVANLANNNINILYVIGGDGSQTVAHRIARNAESLSVVGLPKTMDNDLLWVWQSFGFNTAVERATEIINIMNCEACSTRRVCVVELFGAESGFISASSVLASGHANLVLIPEEFKNLTPEQCETALQIYVKHLQRAVNRDTKRPHGVVVVAEGVGKLLTEKSVKLAGHPITGDFVGILRDYLESRLRDTLGEPVPVFVNRPLHQIRAGKANAHDQMYCERLGALAVDNALAGYTDFMISQWLTEYVLVPLELVAGKRKSIPLEGIFWKQVCSSTGQPSIAGMASRNGELAKAKGASAGVQLESGS
ncbi:MAG TPA: 6-phosphofructokinase [Bryobacteraceae bacterium]|jgi:6-phosphofructokinase 1|nr:6-phosphofructokinase [Bryobacteraceae bacterium]